MKLYNDIKTSIAIYADYSKAFDIIDFNTLIQKMHSFNFSKDFLHWTINYLTIQLFKSILHKLRHIVVLLFKHHNSEYHKVLYYEQYC